MTSPTPNQGLALPTSASLNNVPGHLAAYNSGVENRLVQRYSSSIDREVRNPTPVKGEISYLEDTDRHERFDGTGWKNIRGGLTHSFVTGELGRVLLSFSNDNSYYQQVFFAVPFSVPPVVFANITSPSGATAGWFSRTYSVTTESFFVYVAQAAGINSTWTNVPVDWAAFSSV